MQLIHDDAGLRSFAGCSFVPTMGALHAGHAALIRKAASFDKPVVVSIFVNPTQFAPSEDFSRYPRQLDHDAALAAEAGAAAVFAPSVETIYPPDQPVATPPLPPVATQPGLEDAFRPTHFAGVCQVVARLFDLVQPSVAVFGEKDYQQLRVITDMVLAHSQRWPNLRIEPLATVRERDGLAMSSRNVYLSAEQRQRALTIWRSLSEAAQEHTPHQAELVMRTMLDEAGFDIDYAAVRNAQTLLPLDASTDTPARALIAARLGNVRLIDNRAIRNR